MTYTYASGGADGMTNRTETMERVKALRAEARQAEQGLRAAQKLVIEVKEILEDLKIKQADALGEARELKPLARLEDLSVYKVEKKGKTNEYWHATWRHGHKVCNVYLGSCKKLAGEQALQKAKKIKARDLGITIESMAF
jgi:hypothetical protein